MIISFSIFFRHLLLVWLRVERTMAAIDPSLFDFWIIASAVDALWLFSLLLLRLCFCARRVISWLFHVRFCGRLRRIQNSNPHPPDEIAYFVFLYANGWPLIIWTKSGIGCSSLIKQLIIEIGFEKFFRFVSGCFGCTSTTFYCGLNKEWWEKNCVFRNPGFFRYIYKIPNPSFPNYFPDTTFPNFHYFLFGATDLQRHGTKGTNGQLICE